VIWVETIEKTKLTGPKNDCKEANQLVVMGAVGLFDGSK